MTKFLDGIFLRLYAVNLQRRKDVVKKAFSDTIVQMGIVLGGPLIALPMGIFSGLVLDQKKHGDKGSDPVLVLMLALMVGFMIWINWRFAKFAGTPEAAELYRARRTRVVTTIGFIFIPIGIGLAFGLFMYLTHK